MDPPAGADATSTGPPDVDGSQRAWPWAVVAVVVLAVGGALVGGGVSRIGGGVSTSVDDDVALPTEEAADPADGSDDGERRSYMTCAPPGCQVWRVDEPVGRGVEVSDELVLHLGDDEMVAYAAADGREVWRQPTPGRVSQNPWMTTLSEHGLALVHGGAGGLAPGTEPGDASIPMQVSVHDVADGTHRIDLELDAEVVLGATWVGDRLVVRTAGSSGPRGSGRTFAFSPGGELLWSHEADGPVQVLPDGQTLLELGENRVRRIAAHDGSVAWEVSGSLAARPRPEAGVLVSDRTAGRIHVVGLADGTVRTTVPADGARGATGLGPWVLVAHDEEIRVHDRSSGELLFTRERRAQELGGGPMRRATATRVGDRVVVAWGERAPGEEELELEVRTLDGELDRTLTLAQWGGGSGTLGLHQVGSREDVVLVSTFGGPGTAAAVAVHSGEVLRRWTGGMVRERDGLLVLQHERGLVIVGPDGQIQLRHVDQVASLDPLVVHGAGGMMRIDRSLVADPE